jgi:hypothetical protein
MFKTLSTVLAQVFRAYGKAPPDRLARGDNLLTAAAIGDGIWRGTPSLLLESHRKESVLSWLTALSGSRAAGGVLWGVQGVHQ